MARGVHAPDVSVIVPVHDSAAYLPTCLSSVLAQTYGNFELICVDDGSTDESPQLLAQAAAADARVHVLTQPARGVSAARNAGLDAARGAYIAFADADDAMEPRLLERATAYAREHDTDMLIFGYWYWFADKDVCVKGMAAGDEKLYAAPFSLTEHPELPFELSTANVWRMLWKRGFVEDAQLRFNEQLRYSEDAAFIWQAESLAERIVLVRERLYRYRRDGRGAASRSAERDCGMIDALGHVQRFLQQRGIYDDAAQARLANSAVSQLRHGLRTAVSAQEFDDICARFERDWLPFVKKRLGALSERNAADISTYCEGGRQAYLFTLFERQRGALTAQRVNARRSRERLEQRQRRELAKLQREREAERAEAAEQVAALEAENAALARALADARAENGRLRGSRTFRLGAALLAVPRALKARLCKRRESN